MCSFDEFSAHLHSALSAQTRRENSQQARPRPATDASWQHAPAQRSLVGCAMLPCNRASLSLSLPPPDCKWLRGQRKGIKGFGLLGEATSQGFPLIRSMLYLCSAAGPSLAKLSLFKLVEAAARQLSLGRGSGQPEIPAPPSSRDSESDNC